MPREEGSCWIPEDTSTPGSREHNSSSVVFCVSVKMAQLFEIHAEAFITLRFFHSITGSPVTCHHSLAICLAGVVLPPCHPPSLLRKHQGTPWVVAPLPGVPLQCPRRPEWALLALRAITCEWILAACLQAICLQGGAQGVYSPQGSKRQNLQGDCSGRGLTFQLPLRAPVQLGDSTQCLPRGWQPVLEWGSHFFSSTFVWWSYPSPSFFLDLQVVWLSPVLAELVQSTDWVVL